MNAVSIAKSILSLVAGVGVFLIACTMMSSNLESLGSRKMKALFAKTSNSKLLGGGFGLGLAVVKKICQKSGWDLRLESQLGVGSKFTIQF